MRGHAAHAFYTAVYMCAHVGEPASHSPEKNKALSFPFSYTGEGLALKAWRNLRRAAQSRIGAWCPAIAAAQPSFFVACRGKCKK